MLQLTVEVLRDILWDGGLKQLSHVCGHKKLPTQWQEIHMLLLALHETLLRKAVYSVTMIIQQMMMPLTTTNSQNGWGMLTHKRT